MPLFRSSRRRCWLPIGAVCLAFAAAGALAARAADPLILWRIVHETCVPAANQTPLPKPCVQVDPAAGFVVLKDIVGATQYLLIPTARVTGIEDPVILAADAPNYWRAGWQARRFTEQSAGHPLPRDTLSLAINSPYARSQDQLHIHVDCVRADVRDALQAGQATIGPRWTEFPQPLAGNPYRVMRIAQPELGDIDPFRVLAGDVKLEDMREHTLVLIGIDFKDGGPGFVLLDGRLNLAAGDLAHGEALQDHDCALAR